jgi:alpha-methylacyl-CoA racemase
VTPAPPLNGIRVICTQAMGPIPHATMLLGDLGADVIRIDRATTDPELTGLRAADDPRTRGHRTIGARRSSQVMPRAASPRNLHRG